MSGLPVPIAQFGGIILFIIFGALFGLVFTAVGGWIIWSAYQKTDLTYDFNRQSKTTVGSLSDGDVAKVEGTIRKKDKTTTAPINNVDDAVIFDYKLERYHSDDEGGHWETVDSDQQNAGFYIEDETGNKVLIPSDANPDVYATDSKRTRKRATKGGADFQIDTLDIGNVNLGGQHMRHTQKAFTPGDDIIVYGTAKKMEKSGFEGPSLTVREGSAIEHFAITDEKGGLPSYLQTIALGLVGLVFAGVGLFFLFILISGVL